MDEINASVYKLIQTILPEDTALIAEVVIDNQLAETTDCVFWIPSPSQLKKVERQKIDSIRIVVTQEVIEDKRLCLDALANWLRHKIDTLNLEYCDEIYCGTKIQTWSYTNEECLVKA